MILIIAWLKSHFLKICPNLNERVFDLRRDNTQSGKKLTFALMKAQPHKSFWFGHMWVIWPEAPPLASNGAREAGFYAQCKLKAAKYLVLSILSPIGPFTGQKPIEGVFLDDRNTDRHWQFHAIIDEATYQEALKIDTKWRLESRYALRPKIGGRTYSCRDYVFEIAQTIGLKRLPTNWAAFPAESFHQLLSMNAINAA